MSLSTTSLTMRLCTPQALDTAVVQRHLADTFLEHPEIYRFRECAANIRALIDKFTTPVMRQRLNVLVLLSQRVQLWEDLTMRRYLLPSPRQALHSGVFWPHHVLLSSGGRVYDFDYQGVPGTDIGDYVAQMFAAGADSVDAIVVPAVRFGSSLSDVLWRTLYGQQFKRLPLPQFAAAQREQYGRQSPYPDLMTRQQSHADYYGVQAAV